MLVHVFHSTIVSGPETLVIPALSRLGRPVTVVFACEARREADSRKSVEYARSFGLPVREVWVRSRYDRQAIAELAKVLVDLNAAIVHCHDVKASAYALAASGIAQRAGQKAWKLVSTHHGVRGRSGLKIKAYEWYYTHFVLPGFDRVLAVCNSDRELLIRRGLSSERVVAHLNGVDRDPVLPDTRPGAQAAIRSQWALPADLAKGTVLVGFVGRLAPEKRLDRILRICRYLDRDHPELPDWRLVVFGTGPLGGSLQALASDLAVDHRVLWKGYRSGVGNELAGFDVVLSMSDAEGLPINLVEAGWGGTPVFATRVDGNLDLMPTEDLGVLVDVDQSDEHCARRLAELIGDPQRRSRMGAAFQKRVAERFSAKRWLSDLSGVYAAIAADANEGGTDHA